MKRSKSGTALRLRLLETRVTPATFTVNSLGDSNTGSGFSGDLRYCIANANVDKASADTITFDAALFSTPQTIFLGMGQLPIQGNTTIQGPGADNLTIDGKALDRVFSVDDQTSGQIQTTFVGLRITNGKDQPRGGAVYSFGESITLDRVWIDDNESNLTGGGIYVGLNGKLTVLNSTVSGNTSGTYGGGIYVSGYAYVLIRNSTITGNIASGNVGGGLRVIAGTTTRIENSTITGNHSVGDGGGIALRGDAGPITIESSIIAGNTSGTGVGADISAMQTVTATNSFIGVGDSGFTLTKQGTTISGTKGSPANPQLGPLQNNGGPVPTHMPSAASTVRDLGSNPSGLMYDQRGVGFDRKLQSGVDMGAVESVANNPTATMKGLGPIITPGPTPNTVEVTYKDATAIDWTTIDLSDIQILAPNMSPLAITGVSVDAKQNGPTRVATYTLAVPGGGWELSDNGNYTVNMLGNQVANAGGVFVPASNLGVYSVSFGKNFVVTTTADGGTGSLRQAVLDANASITVGADTITFAVSGTITLASDLNISDALDIQGPGAAVLALTRSGNGHILYMVAGDALSVSDMTLRDANTFGAAITSGAAIYSGGSLTIRNCIISGNSTGFNASGGAVSHYGSLLVENTLFQSNGVVGNKGGGAIYVQLGPALIRGCTFTGNGAGAGPSVSWGGAVTADGLLTIEDSTFSGNFGDAKLGLGGAVGVLGGTTTLRNCTFANNQSGFGGAIAINEGATAVIQNCTITNNQAIPVPTYNANGGGIYNGGTLQLVSSIVSGNVNEVGPDIYVWSNGTVSAANSAIGSMAGVSNFTDLGGNLAPGTNLLMGSLASNGGPTQTVAISAGSPAVNAGSNPSNVMYDQRGNGFFRIGSGKPDIGAYEVQSAPSKITVLQINDGSVQRSRVTSLTVTFNGPVTLPVNLADAFELKSAVSSLQLAASVNANAVTLTFSGAGTEFGSLADGRYTLTAFASKINAGNFDGNADGTPGDDYVLVGTPANGLFRLFGDSDGNGTVNTADFNAFRSAFGGSNPIFDFDGLGGVGTTDFNQFRQRFGASV